MASTYVRAATHAATGDIGWYDARPSKLRQFIDASFASARHNEDNKDNSLLHPKEQLLGVIAPHAGLRYSGATAAKAYQYLRHYLYNGGIGNAVQRIFILGPSHHKGIYGLELSAASSYDTPFGPLTVDTEVINELMSRLRHRGVQVDLTTQSVDENEHSIEMQIPFLSHILHFAPAQTDKVDGEQENPHARTGLASRVKIVPIIVGTTDRRMDDYVLDVMLLYMQDAANVFVYSSDFCHWGRRFRYTYHYKEDAFPVIADSIEAMDHAGMNLIESSDIDGWYEYLWETSNTICGRGPITIGLNWWSKVARDVRTRFVGYAQSNKVKNASDSSVSYAAAVITKML